MRGADGPSSFVTLLGIQQFYDQTSKCDALMTQQLLPDMKAKCINVRNSRHLVAWYLTLCCLHISSVTQVPLHADNNIIQVREMDGCKDFVYDTLFKQNCRVASEGWVCSKCCSEGGGIVMAMGVRDNISRPS